MWNIPAYQKSRSNRSEEKLTVIELISRRDFLSVSSKLVGSSLVLGIKPLVAYATESAAARTFSPSVYLAITSGNVVQVICHRSEMGQGVRTSMAMLIVEELDVPRKQIEIVQAVGDKKY